MRRRFPGNGGPQVSLCEEAGKRYRRHARRGCSSEVKEEESVDLGRGRGVEETPRTGSKNPLCCEGRS